MDDATRLGGKLEDVVPRGTEPERTVEMNVKGWKHTKPLKERIDELERALLLISTLAGAAIMTELETTRTDCLNEIGLTIHDTIGDMTAERRRELRGPYKSMEEVLGGSSED